MTRENPSPEEAFRKHADMTKDEQPRYSYLCRAVADDLSLIAGLEELNENRWKLPSLLTTGASYLLRATAAGHPLASYLPTHGGYDEPGDGMLAAYTDFLRAHHDELAVLCQDRGAQWNDPNVVAMFYPALTYAASRDERPLSLIELGSAAGLTIQPDRYGYRFGDVTVGAHRDLILDLEFRGEIPDHVKAPIDVADRVAIDREPVDLTDPAAVAWLRASVRPDAVDVLERLDLAIAEAAGVHVDWRAGDLIDELPGALRDVAADQLPVVYESAVLCCLDERRSRFLDILTESGRDLVWISREGPRNALTLVSDAADDYEKSEALVTAVTFRAGRPVDAVVLAGTDPYGQWIDWKPTQVPLRG